MRSTIAVLMVLASSPALAVESFAYVAPPGATLAQRYAYGACLARVIDRRGMAYAVRHAGETVCDKRRK